MTAYSAVQEPPVIERSVGPYSEIAVNAGPVHAFWSPDPPSSVSIAGLTVLGRHREGYLVWTHLEFQKTKDTWRQVAERSGREVGPEFRDLDAWSNLELMVKELKTRARVNGRHTDSDHYGRLLDKVIKTAAR